PFVEQALARCSVTGSKFWFNCNPGNSLHWFYKEWVDDNSENAMQKNRLHLHLTMEDNYSLSDSVRQRYERMYSGVFYDRYIKGLWVSAEGVIYRDFAENTEKFMLDAPPDDIVFCTIGMDFGGNGSAHAMICTGFTKSLEKVIILDEYYRKEIISPAELEKDVCGFIRRCQQKYRVYDMYCDSAEQVLIKGIKSAVIHEHIPINVHNARKSEIIGRIRFFSSLMAQNRFLVMKQCTHLIEALQSAVWDSKSIKDVRLDNGEYNIDSLDALEYSAEPFMNDILSIHK
ncbi:MAG TPA: PBSX family phage terminase large subunit, partial [Ruminococcus sp.]|nr:PBSX family phage terminase large subunit [Ruminococcus sp.]